MKKTIHLLLIILISQTLYGHIWDKKRPDSHAPIQIMGDHNHSKKEWMTSYRINTMSMIGNKETDILKNYNIAPLKMNMTMFMFGEMYGLSNQTTLMIMLPYIAKNMNLKQKMGNKVFSTESKGLGDLKISTITKYKSKKDSLWVIKTGISLPTGKIDKKDNTPMKNNQVLPYKMQLGSGSLGLLLGSTLSKQNKKGSIGINIDSHIQLGKNKRGYKKEDQYQCSIWAAYNISSIIGTSISLTGKSWGNISGNDAALNPNMVPTAKTNIAANIVETTIGVNIINPFKLFEGHRFALALNIPLYESCSCTEMKNEYSIMMGWQYQIKK